MSAIGTAGVEAFPGTAYRSIRVLAHGGQADVYEVQHVELGRRFALKIATGADQDVARVRDEWRVLARLHHPNIVQVTDAGRTADGRSYFVMELLGGHTLEYRLKRNGRLQLSTALRVSREILDGLDAAHSAGILHRDLKPGNIFLCTGGPAKVIDFGLAKTRRSRQTTRGQWIGSPRYMSPEQALGRHVDARTDVYAVGLLLFEMLTGAAPFDDARDDRSQMCAHVNRDPPRLREFVPVSQALEQIVDSVLAKDPCDRPNSALAMRVELDRVTYAPGPVAGPVSRKQTDSVKRLKA